MTLTLSRINGTSSYASPLSGFEISAPCLGRWWNPSPGSRWLPSSCCGLCLLWGFWGPWTSLTSFRRTKGHGLGSLQWCAAASELQWSDRRWCRRGWRGRSWRSSWRWMRARRGGGPSREWFRKWRRRYRKRGTHLHYAHSFAGSACRSPNSYFFRCLGRR